MNIDEWWIFISNACDEDDDKALESKPEIGLDVSYIIAKNYWIKNGLYQEKEVKKKNYLYWQGVVNVLAFSFFLYQAFNGSIVDLHECHFTDPVQAQIGSPTLYFPQTCLLHHIW